MGHRRTVHARARAVGNCVCAHAGARHRRSIKKLRLTKIGALLVAAFFLSFPVFELLLDAGYFAGLNPDPSGATVFYPTGEVRAVLPGTPAARAGMLPGDRIDYARAGWTMRIWIRSGHLRAGVPMPLPVFRDGRPLVLTLVAPRAPPIQPGILIRDVARVVASLIYILLGCAFYFATPSRLTGAFYWFCLSVTGPFANTAWMHVVSPGWEPFAAFLAGTTPVMLTGGFLAFCLRFPTGAAIGRWRTIDRAIPFIAIFVYLWYVAHFFTVAFVYGDDDPLYKSFVWMAWLINVIGAAAFLARYSEARGGDTIRMRWAAVALALYMGILAAFFIDQVAKTNAVWVAYLTLFNPAPFAFAYALVRGRLIDVRIFGGRALVYGVLTAIPVALLAIVDWFFARRLQDARLATVLEVAVAVAFSFWLRGLHRSIDRFVERLFFASRHRAFERVRHITRALPFAERIDTIEAMLSEEIAAALQLTSAAVFRAEEGTFVRAASRDWNGAAERLDPDDPLMLFARSSGAGVHLDDVPRSRAAAPPGDARPAFGLPITVGRRVIAVVLYGNHVNGEPIDAEEEALLNGLAHASATAYEHLHALERERELASLRAQLHLQSSG